MFAAHVCMLEKFCPCEDMGLSTFPWVEYFRRYEDYAAKWGIAPVTGSDAWRGRPRRLSGVTDFMTSDFNGFH